MKILFLGSAGGRRITFRQHRASGGFLVASHDTCIHIDPGPGALVRLIQAGVDPACIDLIVLSHRHMDHCADINAVIEARTMGGWLSKAAVAAPRDAIEGDDPVIFKYHRRHLERLEVLGEGSTHETGSLKVTAALKHTHHGVETYGIIVESEKCRLGYITDGRYTPEMESAYSGCDILIINTTFRNPRDLDHLCLQDAASILKEARPKLGVITHFGAEIIYWGAKKAAEWVEKASGVRTVAAREFTQIEAAPCITISRVKMVNPLGIAYTENLTPWGKTRISLKRSS